MRMKPSALDLGTGLYPPELSKTPEYGYIWRTAANFRRAGDLDLLADNDVPRVCP